MNFQSLCFYNVYKWNKCGGLMVGVFDSIIKINGSNFTNGVFKVNNGKLIEYYPM